MSYVSKNSTMIPVKLNLLLVAFLTVLQFATLFIMPLWLYPKDGRWALLLIPMILLTPLHWALIHEAIHKTLHPCTKSNDLLGRALGIMLFTAFGGLRFGHLMHHRFNRRLDSEYYDPENSSSLRASLHYYWTLLFGLYAMEVVAPYLLSALPDRSLKPLFHRLAKDYAGKPMPELEHAANHYFFRKNRLGKLRMDVLLISLLLVSTIYAHGAFWPVLLAYFVARGFLISVHDNVYHYDTSRDNSQPAKELALPAWASLCMLNFNHHLSHHLSPSTPWSGLPVIHAQKGLAFDAPFHRALWQQRNGVYAISDAFDSASVIAG